MIFSRESLQSSTSSAVSEESIDSNILISADSFGYRRKISLENDPLKEKKFDWKHFLFFGPLILFLILLIGSILVFFVTQRRGQMKMNEDIKFDEQFPDEHFSPLFCDMPKSNDLVTFAQNELTCGLNRSSIIRIYYPNNQYWVKPGENLSRHDMFNPPKIYFNWKFLSKFHTKSFVLILINPAAIQWTPKWVVVHWIRYYSSTLEDKEDICPYRFMNEIPISISQRTVLLYATNSSRMMLRAKTVCNFYADWFSLDDYVHFAQLKLIASTYFLMIYIKESNE